MQVDKQCFAGDSEEGDADGIGQSRCFAAVNLNRTAALQQQLFQLVSQFSDALAAGCLFGVPQLQGFCHADDKRDRFSTGAFAAFLMSSVQQRCQFESAFEQQSADSARSVELVGSEGECCCAGAAKTDWYFSDGLNCVEQQRYLF